MHDACTRYSIRRLVPPKRTLCLGAPITGSCEAKASLDRSVLHIAAASFMGSCTGCGRSGDEHSPRTRGYFPRKQRPPFKGRELACCAPLGHTQDNAPLLSSTSSIQRPFAFDSDSSCYCVAQSTTAHLAGSAVSELISHSKVKLQ